MDIFQPSGNMVIDIGGGTSDIAVLSMGDIVTTASIKTAGDQFDDDILQYIKRRINCSLVKGPQKILKLKSVPSSRAPVKKKWIFVVGISIGSTANHYDSLRQKWNGP